MNIIPKTFMSTLFFSAFFMMAGNQGACADKSAINMQIDTHFVEWSNMISEEEARIQLQDFLLTFNTVEDARKWLTEKGFKVEEPRMMHAEEGKKLSVKNHPVFSLVAGWDVKRNGVIFENNPMSRIAAQNLYYGISLEIVYTQSFNIHGITIFRSSL